MKLIKLLLTYLVIVFFFGCASKKSVSEKVYERKSDTLILKSKIIEQPPILSELTINQVCDTLTGKPKEFKQTFIVSGDTLELSLKNNELNVLINRVKRELENVKSELQKVESEKVKTVISETVKYKVPKWAYFLILFIILFIIFPIVPKVIHGVIRNFFI